MFKQLPAGGDRNFAYLFADGGEGALVDPADPGAALEAAEEAGVTVRYIVATHGHGDHTRGNETVARKTGATVIAHDAAPVRKDVAVKGGETFPLGGTEFRIFHTPGHTVDSICVLWEGRLVSGDTLFVGKVGGTDFGEAARAEYKSLHEVLAPLPDDTEVWPGHDYGVKPSSTMGHEKKTNPFYLRPDFESFVELKRNWLQYKAEHGID
ncbi:MAG: hydroxyacylglutathione hydrolase family protein [Planctomycetota bacterium]|jgi:glyoxylase-like metal-dependent hydrolase (beta-lactamase superfamily II)